MLNSGPQEVNFVESSAQLNVVRMKASEYLNVAVVAVVGFVGSDVIVGAGGILAVGANRETRSVAAPAEDIEAKLPPRLMMSAIKAHPQRGTRRITECLPIPPQGRST
jgi:hypothetical protein